MSLGLTPVQAKCLRFISGYMRENGGLAPNFDELEGGLDVCRSRVHAILTSLEERGAIRRIPNRARCIEITGNVPDEEPWDFPRRLASLSDASFSRVSNAFAAEALRRAGSRP